MSSKERICVERAFIIFIFIIYVFRNYYNNEFISSKIKQMSMNTWRINNNKIEWNSLTLCLVNRENDSNAFMRHDIFSFFNVSSLYLSYVVDDLDFEKFSDPTLDNEKSKIQMNASVIFIAQKLLFEKM